MKSPRIAQVLLLGALMLSLSGCNLGSHSGSGSNPDPPPGKVTIQVAPASSSVALGTTQQFTATVTGNSDTSVTWAVNGTKGGTAQLGTVSASGLYSPPTVVPNPASVTVSATSVADTKASAQAAVTIMDRPKTVRVIVAPKTATTTFGTTQQFTATVTGTSDTRLIWQVNATTGGNSYTGTIDANGRYTAPMLVPNTGAVSIEVVSVADSRAGDTARVTVLNPTPLVSAAVAARFLEQASWGPTDSSVQRVQQLGLGPWIDEQLAAPISTWSDLGSNDGIDKLQNQFYKNAVQGNDQLRQRMAFALSQVMVISNRKVDSHAVPPYVRLLNQDAFGTFQTLLKDVTLSPAMGYYLDMVDNSKPDPNAGTNPNENYAREIMQLFSIGTSALNQDGTLQVDGSGNTIPNYTQNTIEGFAHVFTGWTYPTAPGGTLQIHNPQNWVGSMVVYESNHDTGTKLLLSGVTLPAGQTANKDLDDAMANIAGHPNVGPFICTRLIQHLVMSNPSPAYVNRCSATFANNGSSVRGDLKAVVKEVLLDSEARRGDDPAQIQSSDGRLKEPVHFIAGLLRNLNATTDGANLNWFSYNMRQDLFDPPTVFNFYPPDYKLASLNLTAPEFKIYSTPTALWRANFVNSLIFWGWPDTSKIDFTPWVTLAADDNQLLDAVSSKFMHGAMPNEQRQAIITALQAINASDKDTRARTAIYLAATSSLYSVHH